MEVKTVIESSQAILINAIGPFRMTRGRYFLEGWKATRMNKLYR